MKEYIEREEIVKLANEIKDNFAPLHRAVINAFIYNIKTNIPTADVEPVRHGEWVDKCVRDWHCSLCDCEIQKVRKVDGYCYDDLPRYCPDCGAKMSGGKE